MDDLRHLGAAYFYPFWNEHEYRSWEDAVDDFLRRSPDRAARTPSQIDQFLKTAGSDDDVAETLWDMGFSYAPAEGMRAWLENVRDHIRSGTG